MGVRKKAAASVRRDAFFLGCNEQHFAHKTRAASAQIIRARGKRVFTMIYIGRLIIVLTPSIDKRIEPLL